MGERNSGVRIDIRKKVLVRYDRRCVKCGQIKNIEIHHIKPVYQGGDESSDNLVPLCKACHKYAPDDYVEFIKYLAKPFTPHISVMYTTSLIWCKYYHALISSEEDKFKFEEFKTSTPEEYFKKNIEPMFIGINKLLWGFDDEV
jgi:hypothetical protein